MSPIKIIINGAHGKMGALATHALGQDPQFQIVATLGSKDSLADILQHRSADVVLDLTVASAAKQNTSIIIEHNVRPVIGTSGLTADDVEMFHNICAGKKLGGLIVPNFSLGAILMMRYAKQAASYFDQVEIIETHHKAKQDAPSGTARKTAQLIHSVQAAKSSLPIENRTENKNILRENCARGYTEEGVPIHSIRLSGRMAHQQVIFAAEGETLTIQHDCIDRQAFMPGVLLACRAVLTLDQLVYGLDDLI